MKKDSQRKAQPVTSKTILGCSADYFVAELLSVKGLLKLWLEVNHPDGPMEAVVPGTVLHYAVDVLQRNYPRNKLPVGGRILWIHFLSETRVPEARKNARRDCRRFLKWINAQLDMRFKGKLVSVNDVHEDGKRHARTIRSERARLFGNMLAQAGLSEVQLYYFNPALFLESQPCTESDLLLFGLKNNGHLEVSWNLRDGYTINRYADGWGTFVSEHICDRYEQMIECVIELLMAYRKENNAQSREQTDGQTGRPSATSPLPTSNQQEVG